MTMNKQQAETEARKLLALMTTRGWKVKVWENLGWHYCLEGWHIKVYPTYGGYRAYITMTDTGGMDPRFEDKVRRDPNRAVAGAVERVKECRIKIEEFHANLCNGLAGANDKVYRLTCSDCRRTIVSKPGVWPEGWWVDERDFDGPTRCPRCVRAYNKAMGIKVPRLSKAGREWRDACSRPGCRANSNQVNHSYCPAHRALLVKHAAEKARKGKGKL